MKFKLALCQIKGVMDKSIAHKNVEMFIHEAASCGAKMICLPEMWNCPYANKYFRQYAEDDHGPTVALMSHLAKKHGIWLIGGSIPELDDDRVYNTSYIFSPTGDRMGKHRKAHLFDIDVKGGIRFMESETLTAGNSLTVIETDLCKIGVAICYDVRFSSMFEQMAADGAQLILLPAAFNMTTGPAHWELLMRSRALDNLVYFAACSPARDMDAPYHAFGHSCIVSPWGEYCGKADSQESIVYGDIDLDYLQSIRNQIPVWAQRRTDLI